jgi:putative intracellular protease/amidase
MAERKRVALIVTSHGQMGASEKPTGYWLEEAIVPYFALVDEGAAVVVASPEGHTPPVDPRSVERGRQAAEADPGGWFSRWEKDPPKAFVESVETRSLAAQTFDAAFVAGGHGAMWDLPADQALTSFLGEMLGAGKLVGTVCHGAAVWRGVMDASGDPAVRDRKITCYSDEEEHGLGLAEVVPFMLESALRKLGANVVTGPPRASYAIEDGNLITGQNPASTAQTTALFVGALGER